MTATYDLTHIIHERFYRNRGFAAATSLAAGVLARLAWRLHDFATNHHE